jgi:hypothetical protein
MRAAAGEAKVESKRGAMEIKPEVPINVTAGAATVR